MRIRPAQEEDLERCAALCRAPELACPGNEYLGEQFLADYIDDEELFLVAEEEGDVIGLALAQPFKGDDLELIALVVDEAHRGRGIGKALLDAMRQRARERGKDLFLWAKADKERTLAFYRREGLLEGASHIPFIDKHPKQ